MDLARAKGKTLVNINICSLFKQKIESCNVKRLRQRKRKTNQQKKPNFARVAHFFCTFLSRSFARLQRETSGNILVTRFMED